MTVMDISDDVQCDVITTLVGVLHLGNVTFVEDGNNAVVSDTECTWGGEAGEGGGAGGGEGG